MDAAVWGFIGTVLGALISLGISWMNNRHQYQREEQKLAYEQQKERREQLQEKLEEAHQLLTKIRVDTTPEVSYIMRTTGTVYSHEQRQKSNEDMTRIHMLSEVYFPQLREPAEGLIGLAIRFWNQHGEVMFWEGVVVSKGEEDSAAKHNLRQALQEIPKISQEIRQKAADARDRLREVASSLSPVVIPSGKGHLANECSSGDRFR